MLDLMKDICCGLILMALPGGGNGPEQWQKLFTQQYAALQAAISQRNMRALSIMLTPDFVAYDINGLPTDGQRFMADVAAMPDDPSRVLATQLLTVNIGADNNTARVVHKDTVQMRDHDATGRTRTLNMIAINTDDWIKVYQLWLLRHRETAVYDVFVDGKQTDHRLRDTAPVIAPDNGSPAYNAMPDAVPRNRTMPNFAPPNNAIDDKAPYNNKSERNAPSSGDVVTFPSPQSDPPTTLQP